jgi:hypothetical protein
MLVLTVTFSAISTLSAKFFDMTNLLFLNICLVRNDFVYAPRLHYKMSAMASLIKGLVW